MRKERSWMNLLVKLSVSLKSNQAAEEKEGKRKEYLRSRRALLPLVSKESLKVSKKRWASKAQATDSLFLQDSTKYKLKQTTFSKK